MSVVEALLDLFPDFAKSRRKRRNIRKIYRDKLNCIKRNERVYISNNLDVGHEYLGNRSEQKYTKVNHLIQDLGSKSSGKYIIKENQEEVEDAIVQLISAITLRNWISIGTEAIFIVFIVGVLGASLTTGLVGIDSIVSLIQSV